MARNSSSWGQRLLGVWSLAVYALLLSPAALIVLFSFNAPQGRFNLIWQGFTLVNWQRPLADGAMAQAFATSLLLALVAAVLATLLALPLALVLQRQRPRGSSALELLAGLPLPHLAVPELCSPGHQGQAPWPQLDAGRRGPGSWGLPETGVPVHHPAGTDAWPAGCAAAERVAVAG